MAAEYTIAILGHMEDPYMKKYLREMSVLGDWICYIVVMEKATVDPGIVILLDPS